MPSSFTAIAPLIANMPEASNLDFEPKGQPISVAILTVYWIPLIRLMEGRWFCLVAIPEVAYFPPAKVFSIG